MTTNEEFMNPGNIKFRSKYRETIYFKIREKDETGLFKNINEMFLTAFSIGYHFDKQEKIGSGAINHVNLISFAKEMSDFKQLMVYLILKRKPEITDPKELWNEVGMYAEYGIKILNENWMKNKTIDIKKLIISST